MDKNDDVRVYGVVVTYNTLITDIKLTTYLDDSKFIPIELIIADNSDDEIIQEENLRLSKTFNLNLISMNGNKGLSKAYNKVLDSLNGKKGYVLWLDDDTEVTSDYLFKLTQAVVSKPDIILPMIKDIHGRFVSPNSLGKLFNRPIQQFQLVREIKNFNAINSCTAVNLDIYKNYRYDERLFLDEIDHTFFYELRNKKLDIILLDTVIIQNFSQRANHLTFESAWKRLKLRIRDLIVAYRIRGGVLLSLIGLLKSSLLGLQLSIKIKDLRLLIYSFNYAVLVFIRGK